MIQARNLTKIYDKENTEIRALNGIDLDVETGEFVAIQGPSGCGKSTLLNVIGCLEEPTSGTILIGRIDSIDIAELGDRGMDRIVVTKK